jgi:hypothetical protein
MNLGQMKVLAADMENESYKENLDFIAKKFNCKL